jgi:hypothetical protein
VGLAVGERVVRERRLRVGHLRRIVEQHDLAGVVDAQFLEGTYHRPRQAAGIEGGVRGDAGPAEHETHPAVGEVEAHGHLGAALVGPVAAPEEAAHLLRGVEEVDVHALVEVRLGSELMHVLVDLVESHGHGVTPGRRGPAGAASR